MMKQFYQPNRKSVLPLAVAVCIGVVPPFASYPSRADDSMRIKRPTVSNQSKTFSKTNNTNGSSTNNKPTTVLEGHVDSAAGSQGETRLMRPSPQEGQLQGSTFNTNVGSAVNSAEFAGRAASSQVNLGGSAVNLGGSAANSPGYAGLTTVEVRRLTSHDVVLLIDKSGSMSDRDCPPPKVDNTNKWTSVFETLASGALLGGSSRWDWCGQETTNLGKVMSAGGSGGLSVILFSSMFHIFPHVNWNEIPQIFSENRPGGGTNLARPLEAALADYFDRKHIPGNHARPLAIGIITDGCPSDKQMVASEIIEATRRMDNPKEISITFFLIGGRDPEGEEFVWDLDNKLTGAGARFDIVTGVPFNQLVQAGLPKALAQTLE